MLADASAIATLLPRAPEAHLLAEALESAPSPITIFDAALEIFRKRHASLDEP